MDQLPEIKAPISLDSLLKQSPLQNRLENTGNPVVQWLGRALAEVWLDFEARLSKTPIIEAIENGTITRNQYKMFLRNMRQQVSQGGRWISRAASSMENSHIDLRNALIRHAAEEHQDFKMLESDFQHMGGTEKEMSETTMNIGSQALSAFIINEAGKQNPTGIFGAAFIIEGLGSCKAQPWSKSIQKTLGVSDNEVKFLSYHGVADENHYDNLVNILTSPYIASCVAIDIRRIAKVVARLYILQLEELDNF